MGTLTVKTQMHNAAFHKGLHFLLRFKKTFKDRNILSVNEKLPVSKFRYFGKYIIQLFGYCHLHVSGQRPACLER